ncbi:MAG: hypothetical protein ACYC6C_07615 [Coriobacteriia bacterium]
MQERDKEIATSIAARALLLEPGRSHWYLMPDDLAFAEVCASFIESALEDQSRFGLRLVSNLASPAELWVDIVELGTSPRLVVGRDGDTGDE